MDFSLKLTRSWGKKRIRRRAQTGAPRRRFM
jgi:hypothetical protein